MAKIEGFSPVVVAKDDEIDVIAASLEALFMVPLAFTASTAFIKLPAELPELPVLPQAVPWFVPQSEVANCLEIPLAFNRPLIFCAPLLARWGC